MCPPYFWGQSAAVVVHKEPNLLAALDFTWRKAVTIGKTDANKSRKATYFWVAQVELHTGESQELKLRKLKSFFKS